LSERTFGIISKHVSKIICATEESIIDSMKMIWEGLKIYIEPSSAVTLAIILENREMFANKKVALILSGGNVDLDKLPWK